MKIKALVFGLSLVLSTVLLPASTFAKTISNDNATVAKNEVINDDLFISGGNVKVLGTVNGDVYAAGGEVLINGTVAGDVLAAGGKVTVSGNVKNNVRVAGGSISLDNAKIGRNVTVVGGEISEAGTNVGGKSYTFIPEKNATAQNMPPFANGAGGFPILSFLSTFVIGAVLLKYAKPIVDRVAKEIQTELNASLLAGFLALVITPFVVLFLFITIIGFPLGLMAAVFYVIDIYVSKIFVGVYVGEYINKRFTLKSDNKYLNFAVGLIIIDIAMLIPVVNFFVGILVLLLGLGAIVRVKKAYLFSGKK